MSEVDENGVVFAEFTDVNHLSFQPLHISSDSEGYVFVADWWDHHVLLLNSQLQEERILIDRNSEVAPLWPERLYYNELTSQLYVLHRSSSGFSSEVISIVSLR